MTRFKIGQEIVCTNNEGWLNEEYRAVNGPVYNEIYTVSGYECAGYCNLAEFLQDESWNDQCFEPVALISELEEILQSEPAQQ